MLSRWKNAQVKELLLPLILAAVVLISHGVTLGSMLILMLTFSWLRVKICWKQISIKHILAEPLAIVAGLGYVVIWQPRSLLEIGLAVIFFFLIQALYLLILESDNKVQVGCRRDRFDAAYRELDRILQ